jgi:hypothetical protein
MLPSRTDQLVNQINDARKRRELARDISALKSRAVKFEALDEALQQAVKPVELMRKRHATVQLKGSYSGARDYFAKLRETVADNPQALVGGDPKLGPMQQRLEQIASQTEEAARRAWAAEVDRRGKVRVNETVLRALGRIPEFRESVLAVRRALERRESLKRKLPEGTEDFDEADGVGREIQKTWKAVGSDDIPQAVLDLLHAVGRQSVTLESIDDEVLEWLRRKKLVKYFIVSLAGS